MGIHIQDFKQKHYKMLQLVILLTCFLCITEGTDTGAQQCLSKCNGCSIPGNIPFPYKTFYKPACNKHDVCYSCGNKFGWTRNDCDVAFKADMIELCKIRQEKESQQKFWDDIKNWIKSAWNKLVGALIVGGEIKDWLMIPWGSYASCMQGTNVYYNAVKQFSGPYFEKTPPAWCSFKCAKDIGNP